ncbi:MAG: RNA repair transcriptional activator RtcR [Maricaulaceae bacterium]
MKKNVVIGFLGINLDNGRGAERWGRWRPSVDLCRQDDMLFHRFELLCGPKHNTIAEQVKADIELISPDTEVIINEMDIDNPWDLEEVYEALLDFTELYRFNTETEDYHLHITTGTHVAQICLFLLNEARYLPGKILQLSPPKKRHKDNVGKVSLIDLDLSKYDRLADRFETTRASDTSFLKSGIPTRNAAFNDMIDEIEQVAIRTTNPVLLMGPTGAGKSHLARRIYELKKRRHQMDGDFVEINCATLRGDTAMSTLFGHKRGAYAGAIKDRAGLLRVAHKGLVFLDEIEALGHDEQAMILGAIEDHSFYPVGGDAAVKSDFQLIAGTTTDLTQLVADGHFRADLLARINMWSYMLPGLGARPEDIEPNLNFELSKFSSLNNRKMVFNAEAKAAYLKYALSAEAKWTANFRDLAASVTRLATFAEGSRIQLGSVEREIYRLKNSWRLSPANDDEAILLSVLPAADIAHIDPFDRPTLANVIAVCQSSKNMSEAGRKLFAVSRTEKKSSNDSDRLKKYLAKFDLSWDHVTAS